VSAAGTERGVAVTEVVVPGPALALADLLDVRPPEMDAGEPLPPLWHWVYLVDHPAQKDLGPDGHPARGAVAVPPTPGAHRMFAGGRVTCLGGLRCGQEATRTTRRLSSTTKQGRSGRLELVTVEHVITQAGTPVVLEEQDIVYRYPASAADSPATREAVNPAPREPVRPDADERVLDVSPTLLFRFSALTYNAHRIHYDRDFATGVEGYPGLVIHGPLQALAMAEAARAKGIGARTSFRYRLVAPLFEDDGLVAGARRADDGIRTWVRDVAGRRTAEGWASELDDRAG
jgi:3-methylfumaryl-CoA hydratase